jgi:hypothetical protein
MLGYARFLFPGGSGSLDERGVGDCTGRADWRRLIV